MKNSDLLFEAIEQTFQADRKMTGHINPFKRTVIDAQRLNCVIAMTAKHFVKQSISIQTKAIRHFGHVGFPFLCTAFNERVFTDSC